MARRGLVIGLWLAALAVCVGVIAQSRFVADLSSFLPSDPTPEQRILVDQLREGAVSRVVLIGIEGGDAAARARASQALAARLRADARFASVDNGAAGGFDAERELLLRHRYVLSPRVSAERFGEQGLREAIGETLALLSSPVGMMLRPIVPRDPTGETVAILEGLQRTGTPPLNDGVWTSPDGGRAILMARTRAAGSDTDGQQSALRALEEAFEAIARDSGLRLLATGPGVFSVKARALVEGDVKRLTSIGALLIATVLLLVYRSPLALALGLVPVLSGAVAGLAAIALGFGVVHGITLGFGAALIGEAIDYSIYLFVQAGEGARAGDERWMERFWPTIRLGVLTSTAGFSALLFSGLPGLVQLGVYAITGLAGAALVTRFVLPRLLPASFRIRDVSHIGARLIALATPASRAWALVPALAVLAVIVLAVRWGDLWNRELTSLNPISAQDRRIDAELRAALGASDARHVIAVQGSSAEEALRGAEAVAARLEPLVAQGKLGGYESPARILPSAALQAVRLASLPEAAELRARLERALQGMPLRAERLEPFIADVQAAREAGPLTRERIAGTALELALEGLLFRNSSGRWTALVGIQPGAGGPSGRSDMAAIAESVRAGGADALVIDLKREVDRLYEGYFNRALATSAVGLAIIVLLLLAALRSPRRVLRVLAPVVAGVLVVAAAHALAGSRLTLLHLVGLLLVVAVGSNYSLFFERIRQGGDVATPRTIASLGLANLTTVLGFGILSLSSVPVLHAIGSTVALGALLTLLFGAMLAPLESGPRCAPSK